MNGGCPCGHRMEMCHRVNATRWCPASDPESESNRARGLLFRLLLDHNCETDSDPELWEQVRAFVNGEPA